ncbi:MAG: anaerobic ribonucleoside-triphosphate reductase activating protein [Sarcina sp.]
MRISKKFNLTGPINTCDLINGNGVRVSIFVSGCEHKCPDCFSKHTWNKDEGYEFTYELKEQIIEACSYDHIDGISILGGDPLAPYNAPGIEEFCKEFKERLPHKTIFLWTGYDEDYVMECRKEIVKYANVIVTGKFEKSLSNGTSGELLYRGSTNQKYIINGKIFDMFPSVTDEGYDDCYNCEHSDLTAPKFGQISCHNIYTKFHEIKPNYNRCHLWRED